MPRFMACSKMKMLVVIVLLNQLRIRAICVVYRGISFDVDEWVRNRCLASWLVENKQAK